MEKAYDLKELVGYLKNEGLEIAEEGAKSVYSGFMKWVEDSAKLSKNPFDDVVVFTRKQIDGVVLPQIDKINPADNV
jgi:hypothetical protein